MKNLHYLGFILWFVASYFSLILAEHLYLWYDDKGILFKVILLVASFFMLLINLYKIPLSLLLLMGRNLKDFNLVTTIYSIIGLIGLLLSYFYNGFEIFINKGSVFDKALSISFLFTLILTLVRGFILMPKSINQINPFYE